MLIINGGTFHVGNQSRLECDRVEIGPAGAVRNLGTVHTWTTINGGAIAGGGTWWARYDTSKPIGGVIDPSQIVIYWPSDRRLVLPVPVGGLVSIPKFIGDGGIS